MEKNKEARLKALKQEIFTLVSAILLLTGTAREEKDAREEKEYRLAMLLLELATLRINQWQQATQIPLNLLAVPQLLDSMSPTVSVKLQQLDFQIYYEIQKLLSLMNAEMACVQIEYDIAQLILARHLLLQHQPELDRSAPGTTKVTPQKSVKQYDCVDNIEIRESADTFPKETSDASSQPSLPQPPPPLQPQPQPQPQPQTPSHAFRGLKIVEVSMPQVITPDVPKEAEASLKEAETLLKRKREPPLKATVPRANPKSQCRKPCANCGDGAKSNGFFFSIDKTGFNPTSNKCLIFCNSCVVDATGNNRKAKRICNFTRTDGSEITIQFYAHDHAAIVCNKGKSMCDFGAFSTKEVAGESELFFTREGGEPRQVTSNGGRPFRTGYTRQVPVFQETPTLRLSQSRTVQSSVSTVSRMDTPNTDTDGSDTETDENADEPV